MTKSGKLPQYGGEGDPEVCVRVPSGLVVGSSCMNERGLLTTARSFSTTPPPHSSQVSSAGEECGRWAKWETGRFRIWMAAGQGVKAGMVSRLLHIRGCGVLNIENRENLTVREEVPLGGAVEVKNK
ncbi:hypothetical protein N657DRAFT_169448 [Parathielavia appendiculata]|uniref:Uncharacterized protein n=1 Tax=Parathielavia appendiculata TaxID=2587402 RepID=A0AAN6TTG5_9PEZI|nr:hypothetical protein N657DRAFT_169448 [Parathielavia appendiculata]